MQVSKRFDEISILHKGAYYFPEDIKPSNKREGLPFEIQAIYKTHKLYQDTMYITEEFKNQILNYYELKKE